MDPKPDDPLEFFATPAELERWLRKHHAKASCLWVKYAKKKSGIPSIDWNQAVDVALCYGWIDGQRAAFDETWFLQRFTPRRPRSPWSRANRDTASRLLAEGLMQPAGREQVERAQADGRWDAAYEGSRSIEVPADFRAALDANPAARDAFAGINRTNRFAFLYRINEAKRPQTRAARIEKFVAMLAAGETLH